MKTFAITLMAAALVACSGPTSLDAPITNPTLIMKTPKCSVYQAMVNGYYVTVAEGAGCAVAQR